MNSRTLKFTVALVTTLPLAILTAEAQGPGRGHGRGQGQGHGPGHGRGLPAEARETIHGLFDAHAKFKREVTKTEKGYVSKTTSEDPATAKLLQTHVKQMENRLKAGMMVRRWDPAYEEFVNHYDDIEIKITNIEKGISVVAEGATEEARKVARNHAGIVSKFIKHGWSEHDKTHPAVAKNGKAGGDPQGAGKLAASCCAQCAGKPGEAKAAKCEKCAQKPAEAKAAKCEKCAQKPAEAKAAKCEKCAKDGSQ